MVFGQARRRRRPSLTPMIDVVFLLLVFFMLAARFGVELHLPLNLSAGSWSDWQGPPRLIDIRSQALMLNGVLTAPEDLASALTPLMTTPQDMIVLRAGDEVALQNVVSVIERLTAADLTNVVLVD